MTAILELKRIDSHSGTQKDDTHSGIQNDGSHSGSQKDASHYGSQKDDFSAVFPSNIDFLNVLYENILSVHTRGLFSFLAFKYGHLLNIKQQHFKK